ncbi:hypothetical protein LV84_01375 [Algoriphagus ratkowskyi]|uniref:Uncharacterized protein n=1 Tax=Algoriphagus ratkowskyi TaxID=57028 RepID=A0A2W7RFZ5_9BACT|nr:hypothetical protein [Algoriphagus ratkowskyi]PZX59344.1 hypothetical protein LV84_01375 [Algoriphagus ratkowskyi]TXD77390.1 hypothetical protein ESW18_11320 [Algoriphagus ratkowskyi]
MLENVSWGVFLKLLGIVLTCYYGYVVIRYFGSDVSSLLLNRKSKGLTGRFGKNTLESERSSLDNLSALLAEIDGELMANAETAVELIQLLRQKILHYGLPDSTVGRKILMNHLLLFVKSEHFDLTEEDLLLLFNEFPN